MKTVISNKPLLTWDSTRERVGHRTREGGRRPSKGSHGRRRAAKRREGVVKVCSPRAWWGGGRLILLQLGGIRSIVTYMRCGGGGVGIWHRGVFWPILHRRAFVLFALYAAHRLALPGKTQHKAINLMPADWRIQHPIHHSPWSTIDKMKGQGRYRIKDCYIRPVGTCVMKWKLNDLILTCESFCCCGCKR